MIYDEFKRNVGKAGLTIKEFAELIKTNPSSITGLKSKPKVPKHLAIISVLLGELVDKKIPYKHLFNDLGIEELKARGMVDSKKLFKKK